MPSSAIQGRITELGLVPQVDLDYEVIRDVLHAERDARMRPDGIGQFRFVHDSPSEYVEDPWTPVLEREPIVESVDVLVVGAGFGGLVAAVEAKRAGARSIRLLDQAGGFGGTWYWNRYPGIRCDINSLVYLPLLEETGYVPQERYSTGEEILAHAQRIARYAGLEDSGVFHTKVTGMVWNEERAVWAVTTNRGDQFFARFVISQSGLFSTPKFPGTPGLEAFQGKIFHSARWDYDYTGGSPRDELTGLRGKRVALLGTGATGVQCVPPLAAASEHLYVLQRTPTSIAPRNHGSIDKEWIAQQSPGWQRRLMDNFNQITQGVPIQALPMIDDGWTVYHNFVTDFISERLGESPTPEEMWSAAEAADFEWFAMLNARVDEVVSDPEKARVLKSYYRFFCKRPGFSDDYLPAFDRPNVTLIDASRHPIEEFTPTGLRLVGEPEEIPIDCVILATGFEIGTTWTQQAGYDPVGDKGVTLSEKWSKGPLIFQGVLSSGFPNFFFMGMNKSGPTITYTHMLQLQAEHIGYLIARSLESEAAYLDVRPQAEERYMSGFVSLAEANERFYAECTPGYLNSEGRSRDPFSVPSNAVGTGGIPFYEGLAAWRKAGDLEGLELVSEQSIREGSLVSGQAGRAI